jgi:hypothetical protein
MIERGCSPSWMFISDACRAGVLGMVRSTTACVTISAAPWMISPTLPVMMPIVIRMAPMTKPATLLIAFGLRRPTRRTIMPRASDAVARAPGPTSSAPSTIIGWMPKSSSGTPAMSPRFACAGANALEIGVERRLERAEPADHPDSFSFGRPADLGRPPLAGQRLDRAQSEADAIVGVRAPAVRDRVTRVDERDQGLDVPHLSRSPRC